MNKPFSNFAYDEQDPQLEVDWAGFVSFRRIEYNVFGFRFILIDFFVQIQIFSYVDNNNGKHSIADNSVWFHRYESMTFECKPLQRLSSLFKLLQHKPLNTIWIWYPLRMYKTQSLRLRENQLLDFSETR